MKNTVSLPEGYSEEFGIDLQKNKKLMLLVNGIAVLENFEGTGVAKALMSELVKYSKNADYQAIDLTAAPFNEKAIGFYHYLGFKDERIQMVMPLN